MLGIVFKRDGETWLYYNRKITSISDFDGLYETLPETKAEVVDVDVNEVTESFLIKDLASGELRYGPTKETCVIHELVGKAVRGETMDDGALFHELLENFMDFTTEDNELDKLSSQ